MAETVREYLSRDRLCPALAIDPGETVGVAYIRMGEIETNSFSSKDGLTVMMNLIDTLFPMYIIIERYTQLTMCYGQLVASEVIGFVRGYLSSSPRLWLKDIIMVPASVKARTSHLSIGKNEHERDAVRLLRYTLITKFGEDV